MVQYRLGLLGLVCLLLAGCAASSSLGTRYPHAGAHDREISRDLVRMPQDLSVFAEQLDTMPLMTEDHQKNLADGYIREFYAPWKRHASLFTAKEVFYFRYSYPKGRYGFAENLRPIEPRAWQALLDNCNAEAFPSRSIHGIMVTNTALRAMPTHKPFFKNPDKAGEGYPFDYFSHAALWVGTPVFVSHISHDGLWVYVETQRVSGWVPVRDVARVDESFMTRWRSLPLGAVMRDGVVLGSQHDYVSGRGAQSVMAHVGTLLPLQGADVLYPARSLDGRALVHKASLQNLSLSPAVAGNTPATQSSMAQGKSIQPYPVPLTAAALARVGNVMMGQPYGWGGYLDNRDCSALMLDIFTPFGLWLPRNSGQQAKAGKVVSLAKLDASAKKALIRETGKPFTTLLWLPGHIVLYIGEYQGEPAIYHDIWGVRVQDETGATSRGVIGKVAITSLSPGAELPLISSPASLLDRTGAMVFLGE